MTKVFAIAQENEKTNHRSSLIMFMRNNYISWGQQSGFGLFNKQYGHGFLVGQVSSRLGLNFLLFGNRTWERTR
jgi:hypothetical protein